MLRSLASLLSCPSALGSLRLGHWDFLPILSVSAKEKQPTPRTQLRWLRGEEKFEKSGSHHSKRYDWSIFMNYRSAYSWISIPDTTGGLWQSTNSWRSKINITVAPPPPRTKRLCVIPRALGTSRQRRMRIRPQSRFRYQSCWCARVARAHFSSHSSCCAFFALLVLERLLMEQRLTRHENEFNEIKFYSNISTMKRYNIILSMVSRIWHPSVDYSVSGCKSVTSAW
jgi:hypothetical protein